MGGPQEVPPFPMGKRPVDCPPAEPRRAMRAGPTCVLVTVLACHQEPSTRWPGGFLTLCWPGPWRPSPRVGGGWERGC